METDALRVELLHNVSDAELRQIGRLRSAVWRGEPDVNISAVPNDVWLDDLDKVAVHWVVRNREGAIVAAARLTTHERLEDVPYHESFDQVSITAPGPYASLNRLVVSPECRGQGVARRLDEARLAHAKQIGAGCVLVVAVSRRMKALESLGFLRLGPARQMGTLLRLDGSYEVGCYRF